MNDKIDVLVIGAGPSGTIAAAMIRKAGFNVCIVEKEKFPRFVIGESLLPRCMEALEEAGLLEALKKKKFQEKFGAKFIKGDLVCDFNFSDQHTKGWKWTWQMPRADFDNTLAEEVQKMGVTINFETAVTAIEFRNDSSDSITTVVDKSGKERKIEARFIVDASGYGRVIPRLFNLDKPSNLPPRKTMFAHIADDDRNQYEEPNRIIIISHKPEVWIWGIPFSNGNTSVGYVGNKNFFEGFKGSNTEQFFSMIDETPSLKKRFANKELRFEPRTIEGWSMSTEKFYGNRFVLTGNVTEFLDPIFSSGVTLATVSSQTASKLVVRQLNGEVIDWEKEYMAPVMQGVNTFRSYVMGWYDGFLQDIFFSDQTNPAFKNQICSVLAGYVWDTSNPFVKKHDTILKNLAKVIKFGEEIS